MQKTGGERHGKRDLSKKNCSSVRKEEEKWILVPSSDDALISTRNVKIYETL